MKIHNYVCGHCKKDFSVPPQAKRLPGNSYCSKECYSLSRRVSIIGQKFGLLTVLRFSRMLPGHRSMYWCLCECGKEKEIRYNSLRQTKGHISIGCGCKQKEVLKAIQTKPNNHAAKNALFLTSRANASHRGYDFSLTFEQYSEILTQPCFYCKNPHGNKNTRNNKTEDVYFYYNGVDRINNDVGYIVGNVRPACGNCNRAKSDEAMQVFSERIGRIIKNIDKIKERLTHNNKELTSSDRDCNLST